MATKFPASLDVSSIDPTIKDKLQQRFENPSNSNSAPGFSNDSWAAMTSNRDNTDKSRSSPQQNKRKVEDEGNNRKRKQNMPKKRDVEDVKRQFSTDGHSSLSRMNPSTSLVGGSKDVKTSPPKPKQQPSIRSFMPGSSQNTPLICDDEPPPTKQSGIPQPPAAQLPSDPEVTEQLKKQVSELHSVVAAKSAEIDALNYKVEGASTEVANLRTNNENLLHALERQVRDRALHEHELFLNKFDKNIVRLGYIKAARHGRFVEEEWAPGESFRELRLEEVKLERRKARLEEERKEFYKKKARNKKRKDDDGFVKPPPIDIELMQKLELNKLRLDNLKGEEERLLQQRRNLTREKNVHLRECKRLQDQATAKYKNLPIKLHNKYVLMGLLGRGGFSEVYKAYDLEGCRLVACKIHQLISSWPEAKKQDYIRRATREYEIHKDLNHENIVQLFDVFEIDDNSFCTVLEYCEGNDLDFLIKQNGLLSERDAKNKIQQIVNALKYLNILNTPIIHYDLKPANVLLEDGQVKITDFGLSKISEADKLDNSGNMELTSQGAGTYWYLPPECFAQNPKISSKVDIWSVGVIFYQCLYGMKPFGNNQTQHAILQHQTILNAREVKFPEKPKVSEEAKRFMRRCLTYDMSERPDVLAICQDTYLTGAKKMPTSASS